MTPEEREAQLLDSQITAALRGSSSDQTLAWLAAELRTEPPVRLRRRIGRSVLLRRWSVPQLAAAVLGMFLFWHGVSAIFMGRWIAENLSQPYTPHTSLEGGLAMMAVGTAAFACLVRREWLPVAALAAAPLGLAYGVGGISEVTVFAWGAVFHLSEGVAALAFLYFLWRGSRYRQWRSRKE